MLNSSISEIKKELRHLSPQILTETILRLSRYKKDNKELVNYLLFWADNERSYIDSVKTDIEQQFSEINQSHVYFAKKSIRKILRYTQKHIKYSGQKQTEIELLIHFCMCMKNTGLSYYKDLSLNNMYIRQIQKIEKSLEKLHEDVRHDYIDSLLLLKTES